MEQQLTVMKMVWGALLASVVVYGAVFLSPLRGEVPNNLSDDLRNLLFLVAFLLSIAAYWAPRIAAGFFKSEFRSEDKAVVLRAAFKAFMYRMVLGEAVSILGLAMAMLSGEVSNFISLAVVTVFIFLRSFPTYENLMAMCGISPGSQHHMSPNQTNRS